MDGRLLPPMALSHRVGSRTSKNGIIYITLFSTQLLTLRLLDGAFRKADKQTAPSETDVIHTQHRAEMPTGGLQRAATAPTLPKRKATKRRAQTDGDWVAEEAKRPKQQSSPYIGVTKVSLPPASPLVAYTLALGLLPPSQRNVVGMSVINHSHDSSSHSGRSKRQCMSTDGIVSVAQYKRTGRFEAHVWNSNAAPASNSGKKGRQIHLGSFQDGARAARRACMSRLRASRHG